jgi:hypothetical protein
MSTLVAPNYQAVTGWERIPAGYAHPDVAAVAVDSKDRVFLFCRSEHPVMIYERDGRFAGSWGEGAFTMRTHGITIGPDDSVYCTDDAGHSVRKFTPDGKLLLTLGANAGKPSDTGYDGSNITTIARGAPPFNRPTNLAVAPNGDLFVSDGYGNARVHRFSSTGIFIASWGEPGTGPGQFMLPHGIAVDATGNVLVCDRESDRIQVFTAEGRFIREITEVQRPTQIALAHGLVYVSELGWRAGQRSFRSGQLLRPARPRGRFAWRSLRRRGGLDHRRKSRARAAGVPHHPEASADRLGAGLGPAALRARRLGGRIEWHVRRPAEIPGNDAYGPRTPPE